MLIEIETLGIFTQEETHNSDKPQPPNHRETALIVRIK
jgi:hypothetical protein